MAAAAKAAAAGKGSGLQRDEEQQPLMQQQPNGAAAKDGAGGTAKGSGEGRAVVMATPGKVTELKKSDAMLPTSVRVYI